MSLKYVTTPKEMEPLFEKAEQYVEEYFRSEKRDPANGTITIGGERYILVRATSMSVGFLEFIMDKFPGFGKEDAYEAASNLLFDISHSIGKADAKNFHSAMNVKDPIAKLSSGPVHFAFTGWANVNISPESKPSPDDNFYLLYDHPHSFEADAWISSKKKVSHTTCFMNSGYSSGWCEESFGVNLTAKEILCKAKGDPCCRFIMAHPDKIEACITLYKNNNPNLFNK